MDVKTLQFFPWLKGTHQENKRTETAQEALVWIVLSQTLSKKGRCSTLVTSGPVPSSGLVQCLGYLICWQR